MTDEAKLILKYSTISMAVFVMLFAFVQNIMLNRETEMVQSEYENLLESAYNEADEYSAYEAYDDAPTFDFIATTEKPARFGSIMMMPVDNPTIPTIRMQEIASTKTDSKKKSEPELLKVRRGTDGMRIDFPALHSLNSEIMGWIRIDGTIIDYPIVQHTDNDYYLTHSFRFTETNTGCLFFDCNTDILHDANYIVYGHNLGRTSKNMFTGLLNYYDPAYWKAHRHIQCDTLAGSGTWEVFAVMRFNIDKINEFNYTQQEFGSEIEFNKHIENIQKHAVYDTGIKPKYGQKLLTLSTCDRDTYGKSGRCVIIAVK